MFTKMSIRIIIVLFGVTIIHDTPYVKKLKHSALLKIEKMICAKFIVRNYCQD